MTSKESDEPRSHKMRQEIKIQTLNDNSIQDNGGTPIYELPILFNEKLQHLTTTQMAKTLSDYYTNLSKAMQPHSKKCFFPCRTMVEIRTNENRSIEKQKDTNDDDIYISRSGREMKRIRYDEIDDLFANDTHTVVKPKKLQVVKPKKFQKTLVTRKQSPRHDHQIIDAGLHNIEEKDNIKVLKTFNTHHNSSDDDEHIVVNNMDVEFDRIRNSTEHDKSDNRFSLSPDQASVVCPICGEEFTKIEIQYHAATCGNTLETVKSSIQKKCSLCDKFFNNNDYANHIKNCALRKCRKLKPV